jgi:proteasome lid subunit RPN8/RPN11
MITLKPETLSKIYDHAKDELPNECCGAILETETGERVRRCRNVQNERHEEDPDRYPRDARTAYYIDSVGLLEIYKASEAQQLKALYHSHPNREAYFSKKDKADAIAGDRPTYPGTIYLVISVYEDTDIRSIKAFAWDEMKKDFIEVGLEVT